MTNPKPAPSELAKHLGAIMSRLYTLLLSDMPSVAEGAMPHIRAVRTGLADLEARLAAAERERDEAQANVKRLSKAVFDGSEYRAVCRERDEARGRLEKIRHLACDATEDRQRSTVEVIVQQIFNLCADVPSLATEKGE